MGDGQSGETRIGVVVVHGIGEQQRFEHLDGQVRALVAALAALKPAPAHTRRGQRRPQRNRHG